MPLTLGRANFMVKHKVAGIVITPHMLKVLAGEKQAGIQTVFICAALAICKHLGLRVFIYLLVISQRANAA